MNPVVLICSRRASSRVPEKAFRKLGGVSTLAHILNRVWGRGVPVIVLVPHYEKIEYCRDLTDCPVGVPVFGGIEQSPLHRMADWLIENPGHDWVVRITHDDPLIHWETVDDMLSAAAIEDASVGYIKASGILEGAGVELIHADNLLAAAAAMKEPTEFVSYYVRGEGLPRPLCRDIMTRTYVSRPDYRLTLDYPEDATLLDLVFSRLGPGADAGVVAAYLDQHPELLGINRLPALSFYTCARNAGRWIGQAMTSVLQSQVPNLEYVVVDDGSTDNTLDEIARFLPDSRVKLVVNPTNVGLAASSNIALKNCRGRWVMRVDADDRLAPDFYYRFPGLLAWAEKDHLDVVYPAYATISEFGMIDAAFNDPAVHNHIGGALVRAKLLNEIRFKDGLRHWDGLELYQRLSARGARLAYTPQVLWQYRQTPGSMSRTDETERTALKAAILEKPS